VIFDRLNLTEAIIYQRSKIVNKCICNNTLLGCMYDMPTETDPISTTFSLMFFLFGSSAMAAAFGAFVSLSFLN
jgi:hypothetical protein